MTTTDGRAFQATVFVDASYEGDLLARSGVSYTVGRVRRWLLPAPVVVFLACWPC
jgi:hypothetical protein